MMQIHQQNEHVRKLYLCIVFRSKPNPMKIHSTTSVIEHELPTSW